MRAVRCTLLHVTPISSPLFAHDTPLYFVRFHTRLFRFRLTAHTHTHTHHMHSHTNRRWEEAWRKPLLPSTRLGARGYRLPVTTLKTPRQGIPLIFVWAILGSICVDYRKKWNEQLQCDLGVGCSCDFSGRFCRFHAYVRPIYHTHVIFSSLPLEASRT